MMLRWPNTYISEASKFVIAPGLKGFTPVLGWVMVAAVMTFMVALEIVQGHGVHLVMVSIGLLALIGWT